MTKTIVMLVIIAFATLSTSFLPPKPSKHFTIHKLSEGVWAAINNDNYGHAICNAGIVDLGDKTVIFDPFMNIDAAIDLKTAAKELTRREASIIINSHYHNDHIRGDQIFLPATIISTSWTKARIATSEPEELAWEKENAKKMATLQKIKLRAGSPKEVEEAPLWIGYYEGMVINGPKVRTTLPSLTFNDSMRIHGSRRSLLLKEYKNGHTASDIIMILPKEGIAFMGDLLFEKRHPYWGDGNPEAWQAILQELNADNSLHQFVPGHGNVTNKTALMELHEYINDLTQLVLNARSQGVADSVIKSVSIPAKYDSWKLRPFFGFNLAYLLKR